MVSRILRVRGWLWFYRYLHWNQNVILQIKMALCNFWNVRVLEDVQQPQKDPSVGAGGSLYKWVSRVRILLLTYDSHCLHWCNPKCWQSCSPRWRLNAWEDIKYSFGVLVSATPAQFYTCMFCVMKGHVLL
jgi:hypothetical protein